MSIMDETAQHPPRGRIGMMRAAPRPVTRSGRGVVGAVVAVVGLSCATIAPHYASATAGMVQGAPAPTGAVGISRAAPVPYGEEAAAGPLRLQVLQVEMGQEATDRVVAANPNNDPPREGITYVLVDLRVRNEGAQPLPVDGGDFALTGSSGIVRRFAGADAPDPALHGTVEHGATLEGWVVLTAPVEEQNLLLIFDSLTLAGNWADRIFALQEGASVKDAAAPVAPANDAGVDPAAPAGLNAVVITADWKIELLETVTGAAVFDLVDYRTGALGPDDATGNDADNSVWLALRLRVTNVHAGGGPAFLPPNAFTLADESGAPVLDIQTLTPPRPDASATYYPGASGEGWVAFDVPAAYTAALIRFLPYATNDDPRYLTYQ
jgi:hypothetical protein